MAINPDTELEHPCLEAFYLLVPNPRTNKGWPSESFLGNKTLEVLNRPPLETEPDKMDLGSRKAILISSVLCMFQTRAIMEL